METAHKHAATVFSTVGPMVVMAFGLPEPAEHPDVSRVAMSNSLRKKFGQSIKAVHGSSNGHFGDFGDKCRIAFTFTFPGFGDALVALGRLEFGKVEELRI